MLSFALRMNPCIKISNGKCHFIHVCRTLHQKKIEEVFFPSQPSSQQSIFHLDVETIQRFIKKKKNIDAMVYVTDSFSPFLFTLHFNSLLLAFDEFPFSSGTRRHRRTFFRCACFFFADQNDFRFVPISIRENDIIFPTTKNNKKNTHRTQHKRFCGRTYSLRLYVVAYDFCKRFLTKLKIFSMPNKMLKCHKNQTHSCTHHTTHTP